MAVALPLLLHESHSLHQSDSTSMLMMRMIKMRMRMML